MCLCYEIVLSQCSLVNCMPCREVSDLERDHFGTLPDQVAAARMASWRLSSFNVQLDADVAYICSCSESAYV